MQSFVQTWFARTKAISPGKDTLATLDHILCHVKRAKLDAEKEGHHYDILQCQSDIRHYTNLIKTTKSTVRLTKLEFTRRFLLLEYFSEL